MTTTRALLGTVTSLPLSMVAYHALNIAMQNVR
jgi:hypothetical protein